MLMLFLIGPELRKDSGNRQGEKCGTVLSFGGSLMPRYRHSYIIGAVFGVINRATLPITLPHRQETQPIRPVSGAVWRDPLGGSLCGKRTMRKLDRTYSLCGYRTSSLTLGLIIGYPYPMFAARVLLRSSVHRSWTHLVVRRRPFENECRYSIL